MTKVEAAKLLELIQLAYPEYGKGTDDAWKLATLNMWHSSFLGVPYQIMEQAFNHFRMHSKFAPKVSEMVDELRYVHYQALEMAMLTKHLCGDAKPYYRIMEATKDYVDNRNLGLNLNNMPMLGGGRDAPRIGTSGDN